MFTIIGKIENFDKKKSYSIKDNQFPTKFIPVYPNGKHCACQYGGNCDDPLDLSRPIYWIEVSSDDERTEMIEEG